MNQIKNLEQYMCICQTHNVFFMKLVYDRVLFGVM